METYEAIAIDTKLATKLVRIGDLNNFEGPLLSLFVDSGSDKLFVFDWIDNDSQCNRWLVYEVNPFVVLDFIDNKVSHFSLFKSSPDQKYYLTDLSTGTLFYNATLNLLKSVPVEYIPNRDSFFNDATSKNLTQIRTFTSKICERATIQPNCYTITANKEFLPASKLLYPKNKIPKANVVLRNSTRQIRYSFKNNTTWGTPDYKIVYFSNQKHFLKTKELKNNNYVPSN